MFEADINYLAVLVATVAYMALGALWYSKVLFVKPWAKALGKNPDDMGGGSKGFAGPLLISAISALVMSFILAHFVSYIGATTVGEGAVTGLLAAIGFVATTHVTNSAFAGTPRSLLAIDVGYPLVGLMIMGAILAVWQ